MQNPAMSQNHTATQGDDLFALAMASSTGGMAILDPEGRWREVNRALERLVGCPAAQLAGETFVSALAARDREPARRALAAASDAPQQFCAAFAHPGGNEIRARVDVAPMRDGDGRLRALVVHAGAPVSAAAGQGDEIDAIARRLAESEAALASLNRLQASFAHGVSHDLRAPLRAIDSFSALLEGHRDGGLDATARDYITRIRAASGRMATLIDSLLELSQAMRAELRPVPVDLGLLVDWAYAELSDADPGRDAHIEVQPGLEAQGDERLLRQLLCQLLHNAWKFSRDRGEVRVHVDGERRGDRIVLRVRDEGCGFDMRYADKLFEPFQRLHGSEQAAGNGIGLAIVRCIAERHGGRAWAHSEPGAGSTFFVELPAVPDTGNPS